ncbi:hypothetical protein ACLOJK_041878 [Asimina triloba]
MGFGDGLNWMNEKLRQSVPDMTAAKKACQGSYDLGRYACGKVSEGAEKLGYCPDSQSALKAAVYVGDVVINESLKGFPGLFARDGLHSLHGGMKAGHPTNRIEELLNRIEKLEEDIKLRTELNRLLLKQKQSLASSSRTVSIGSIMEQKPQDALLGSNMEEKPEDVIKGFLMGGFRPDVILGPLVVSKVSKNNNLYGLRASADCRLATAAHQKEINR